MSVSSCGSSCVKAPLHGGVEEAEVGTFVWTRREVRRALGLAVGDGADRVYRGLSTDSRRLREGELFVALKGERFDGADFVADAARAGAAGAVVERRPPGPLGQLEIFEVPDTLQALGALARHRRRALDVRTVAVTGTNGKTTARELLAAMLRSVAPTYASPGNYNNLVGVPLSLLEAPEEARVWVLELGTNRPGEIRTLGQMVEPDVGVIVSVAEGHLEGLRDLAGVLEEKISLLATIREGGWAVVADEPPELPARAREIFPAVRTAGLTPLADERPEKWSAGAKGVRVKWRGVEIRVPLLGSHNARNLMVVLAAARVLNVPPEAAARALAGFAGLPLRMERRELGSLTLLLDCYNANPGSFAAAIEATKRMAGSRPRAAFVGSMLELGPGSPGLHRRVARTIVQSGFSPVGASGAFADAFGEFRDVLRERLVTGPEPRSVYPEFAQRLTGREVVLLKASRAVRLEEVVPLFERDFPVG